MKHLYNIFADILPVVAVLVLASILIGISAPWFLVASLLALDFAAILWFGRDSHRGGGSRRRLLPLVALSLVGT